MNLTKKMLGDRITKLRKMKGLSQQELAEIIAISRSALTKIETGRRTVSALELNAIARALALPLEQFLSTECMPDFSGRRAITPSPCPAKLQATLLYILERCAGKPNVGETVLYKILYFSDFNYYELEQQYLTGMRYRKLPYGPVPFGIDHFINRMIQEGNLRRVKCRYQSYLQTRYLPLLSPDLTLLSARERAVIDGAIDQFSGMSAAEISGYSHKDKPWMLSTDGQEIDYALVRFREPPYVAANHGPHASDAQTR